MNTSENTLKGSISALIEQLAMLLLRAKAEQLMGEDDAEKLVSMACGCDIPIYEHCCFAGLVDRMRLKETLEQMKKP